jgi:N-hydroxyarylamine O-acetyltransferase
VYPLHFEEGVVQEDPAGNFSRQRVDHDDWNLYRGDALQYRIESHPRRLADFRAMCWYHKSSPDSHFTNSLVCTRRTHFGRVTLSGRRLITTTDDEREEIELTSGELLEVYRSVFGIELDAAPMLQPIEAKPPGRNAG